MGDYMANIHSNISFALVNIPVNINPLIINNDTAFHQLHKKCESRIKYVKYCPHCKIKVKENELVKGYEYNKDNYLIFEKNELNNLKIPNEKEIEIISFVLLNEIDPCYFEKSYLLTANTKSKAYYLFYEALKKTKRVALAKTTLGSKFYYCILRFTNYGIILTTLYFEEEINYPDNLINPKINPKELDLALKIIDSLKGKFEPQKYQDEYQNNIKEAISAKLNGQKISRKKTKTHQQINDLMTSLEKSLKGLK